MYKLRMPNFHYILQTPFIALFTIYMIGVIYIGIECAVFYVCRIWWLDIILDSMKGYLLLSLIPFGVGYYLMLHNITKNNGKGV